MMDMQDGSLGDLAVQGVAAGGLGMLGRLLALSQSSGRCSAWCLLWEVPLAIGMGIIGRGAADWLLLADFPSYALTIAVSYVGPRLIDIALARVAARKG